MIVLESSKNNPDNELVLVEGVKHKICTVCLLPRLLEKFCKDKRGFIGLAGRCRICDKKYRDANKARTLKYNTQYRKDNYEELMVKKKEYADNNKEALRKREKVWRDNNKEKIADRDRKYRENNFESLKAKKKIYIANNIELVRERNNKAHKRRYLTDVRYRLKNMMSAQLRQRLKSRKNNLRTFDILGYTVDELRDRLQSTLPDGYTWDNFLKGELQIDHIKPVSLFNYQSEYDDEFIECWSLKNLQLLTPEDNRAKSNKYDEQI